jgi:hypothetical protein
MVKPVNPADAAIRTSGLRCFWQRRLRYSDHMVVFLSLVRLLLLSWQGTRKALRIKTNQFSLNCAPRSFARINFLSLKPISRSIWGRELKCE